MNEIPNKDIPPPIGSLWVFHPVKDLVRTARLHARNGEKYIIGKSELKGDEVFMVVSIDASCRWDCSVEMLVKILHEGRVWRTATWDLWRWHRCFKRVG